MTDSSSIDNDLVSPAPTAASILGIKGPLRFRRHGSSQKAHVVLRRVDAESDSEGEGEIKGVVQFSLFAYKRIEVKPGKEILLTVADGPFKDRAIILEGDELEGSSLSDVEDETQVAEDDDTLVPPEQSLPLKMRKPWAKRREASMPLGHVPPPRVTHHSIGVQTDPVKMTESIPPTLTDPSPVPQQPVVPTPARRVSKSLPSKPVGVLVSSSSLSDVRVGLPPITKTTTSKMEVTLPRHVERDRSLPHIKVDPTANSPLTPSIDKQYPTSSAPVNQDDISTPTSTDAHVHAKLERWSPSIPVPTVFPATARPADETSDSARSSSVSEDGDPPLAVPERPWSPSVPAALTTQAARRHNIRIHKAEQAENASSACEAQPSLRTEVPSPPGSLTRAPQNPSPLVRTKVPTHPGSFTSGGFVSGAVGRPSSSFSDEDSKTDVLPKRISSPPSSVRRYSRPHVILPPQPLAEVPPSPSMHARTHPPSPSFRKDQSPARRSPASSRASFSHGSLESSASSVPSHPPSPIQSMKKPQTLSWPPFRPGSGRDDGPTDFYPPFRAGPDSCEPSPPLSLRPSSGPAGNHDHAPLNTPIRGRPAVISSSNAIPVAPRHSSFPFSSTPGRPSSPAAQTFIPSQPFAQSMTPKAPLKPPQVPDGSHPPRQPRSGLPLQSMAPAPLGQGILPKAYPQYRHQRHPHTPRSFADGRAHNIPMAAGAKRKASPPRMDPPVPVEIPPKRSPPSTWPTVLPMRCITVQGEHVAIQGITFNRTGKLMAVTCTDCTIRVWDNVMYSEVARLPHSSTVVSAQWMDDDAGVLALCMDGALVRWTRPAGSTPPRAHDVWHWGRILDPVVGATPEDAPTALAYKGDRIAASFPKFGVRIWIMKKGSWQSQRPIDRQNVTAIEFVDDGTALLGGTKDGVLWYCQVSDPALRMYNVFKARIRGIDVLPSGTHAVVSQQVGRAHLVAISHDENRGKVMQVYTVEPGLQADAVYDANAMFVGRHDAVLYGSARGYLFVWDKLSARILCGLDHGEGGCVVQAIGAYRRGGATGESLVVTGSQDGKLNWWAEPVGLASMEELPSGKRCKMS